jgi:hypothetical protein
MCEKARMIELTRTAVELVRARPDMFFSGPPSNSQLASMVMEDVSGAGNCTVLWRCTGPLVTVAADIDWMITERASFEELWSRFVLPTPLRVNAHRSEVILSAMCQSVSTSGKAGGFSQGPSLPNPGDQFAELAGSSGRWLTWTFPPD